jgi:gamma-glutamyl-gamma-aminobutyrate hydrolase PuuD
LKKIGITYSHYEWPDDADNRWRMNQYIEAIEEVGAAAEPLWLPRDPALAAARAAEVADEFDGLMLSGGADLPPAMYGETELEDGNVNLVSVERPNYEMALLHEFEVRDKPILGICYGCQLINVWRGGSLIQDIPQQWPKPIEHSSGRHVVEVLPKTMLHDVIGIDEFEVVTSHHQAIKELGKGGSTAAFALDRLAESIEFEGDHFFLGVQWHPERSRESLASQRLFTAFVEACR